ncbi:MAG: hypothetical protein E7141_02545 [Rikenellaceae bacterium]|nr:hypothetical protein [Rikenellaceae bacterium]
MKKLLIPIIVLMTLSSCQSSDEGRVANAGGGVSLESEWEQEDLAAWRSEIAGYNALFRAIVEDLDDLRDIFHDYVSDDANYATISFADERSTIFSDLMTNSDGYDF